MNYLKLWIRNMKLELSQEFTYRYNFLFQFIGFLIFEIAGPILAIIIYTVSSGIPGWSFHEFLLMQGLFIFVLGIDNVFIVPISGILSYHVQSGEFDKILIRPTKPLLNLIASSIWLPPTSQIFVGAGITIYALMKIPAISFVNLLLFLGIILLAILFLYALTIISASLSFFAVKSFAIIRFFDEIKSVGRYPLIIYGAMGTALLSFIFPIGLAAFYPAEAILGRIALLTIAKLTIVVLIFFCFSLLAWRTAIKHYTSAGG